MREVVASCFLFLVIYAWCGLPDSYSLANDGFRPVAAEFWCGDPSCLDPAPESVPAIHSPRGGE
jgi:hypothetical protein